MTADFDQRIERFLKGAPPSLVNPARATRLLFHAAHRLEARMNHVLEPYGLVLAEYVALAIMSAKGDGPVRPSQLSVSLDATRTQVTRLLDGLEQRGLLQRNPSAQDRRGFDVVPTAAGAKLLAKAAPAVHQAYREVWSAFDAAG